MKKKVLFIINNLNCGGAENALVALLQEIDHSRFEVDLLLFKHEGLLMKKLHPAVNLLQSPPEFKYFDMPLKRALVGSLSMFRFDILLARLWAAWIFKTEKSRSVREQKLWRCLKWCLKKQPKDYDAAVSYLQNTPNYYNIDKVSAAKKIGFIRTDYAKSGASTALDEPYFKKFDKVLAVSESGAATLISLFPSMTSKFGFMHSIFSPATIVSMANDRVSEMQGQFDIVSVGRLHPVKGFDLAIEACALLRDKGHTGVRWHVIGDGGEHNALRELIAARNLQGQFFLLGLKENPYPYIKNAALYVQPSRFEGKSRAVEEAKILRTPILVTNYPSVGDQIEHMKNGFVVDINPESIAGGIEKLIEDETLRHALATNHIGDNIDNAKELQVLYNLIT